MVKLIESYLKRVKRTPKKRRYLTTDDLLEQMSILEFILWVESFCAQVHSDFVHFQNKLNATTTSSQATTFYKHDPNLDVENIGYLKTLESNFKSLLATVDDNLNEKLVILISISNIEGRATYNSSPHISKIEANALVVHLTAALTAYLNKCTVRTFATHGKDKALELQQYSLALIKLYRKLTTNVFSLKDVKITNH